MSRRAQVHDISRARIVQGLRALHGPFDIYESCGHVHNGRDPFALHIEGIGYVCSEGIVATICTHCCCTDPEYGQSESCVSTHKHLPGYALCPTMAIVEGRDSPWLP